MKTFVSNASDWAAASRRAWVPIGLATLSASTQASVFYSNFPDLILGPDPDPFFPDNLTGHVLFNFAVPSITAALGFGATVSFTAWDNIQKKGKSDPSRRQFVGNGGISATLLTAGTPVDASTGWIGGTLLDADLVDVFTGVRVETSPGSGSYRYGWIHFSTGPSAGDEFDATTITLFDAAFETTPDTAITTASIPEAPASVALGFLGLAGGVEAFRRLRARRSAQRSATVAGA